MVLTDEELERLKVHADYLDRCARRELADILRRAVSLAWKSDERAS